MGNEISRREVLNNLIRFKDHLLERQGGEGTERKYRVLLNRKTGDMRFAQKISALEHHIAKKGRKGAAEDWKEVQLIVQAAHFDLKDERGQPLKPSDVDSLAWRIASETVDILNAKAKEVGRMQGGMLVEEAVLQDLSSIHLMPPRERVEELSGWMGPLSRLEAEQRLEGKPVGTYILREGDEITVSISFHFAEENQLSIHPYLLTAVAEEEKIVDILLLQTNKGWTLYRDDPNLNDAVLYQYFPSIQSLLQTLIPIARFPLT